MRIVNLTQHKATPDQVVAGVVDLEGEDLTRLSVLLTFANLPSIDEIVHRADLVSLLGQGFDSAMIGGAPWFMSPLATALLIEGIAPLYAFSQRVSEETVKDGVVTKTNVFKHVGFIGV